MTKQKITKEEYYAVVGLLHMAHELDENMHNVEKAIATILEEEPESGNYYGHVSDACYTEGTTADELLKNLKIQKPKLR